MDYVLLHAADDFGSGWDVTWIDMAKRGPCCPYCGASTETRPENLTLSRHWNADARRRLRLRRACLLFIRRKVRESGLARRCARRLHLVMATEKKQ